MKYKISIFLFAVCFSAVSQQKFSKEISLVTDNDLYISVINDRYYTNGTFLNFRQLAQNNNNQLEKRIFTYKIGHEMFTPSNATVRSVKQHDRPFAAYLYGSFGVKRVYKTNKILETTLQVGVIGSNAFGRELQDFIHTIYGFKKAVGWQNQIKNAFGFQFNAEYSSLSTKNDANNFDFSWIYASKLGTIYTNANAGFLMRFGLKPLQGILNSVSFNTNLNDANTRFVREVESFFYIKPSIQLSLYDATLQGSFLHKDNDVTVPLVPLVFGVEAGFKFTANRFNFCYAYNYNTKRSKGLVYDSGHTFGTISVAYLLR